LQTNKVWKGVSMKISDVRSSILRAELD